MFVVSKNAIDVREPEGGRAHYRLKHAMSTTEPCESFAHDGLVSTLSP